jgi:hypothetical protein
MKVSPLIKILGDLVAAEHRIGTQRFLLQRIMEMGQSFDLLPVPERVRRYRQMSAAAVELADNAPSLERRADYLRLASAWQHLAQELEQEMAHLPRRRLEESGIH